MTPTQILHTIYLCVIAGVVILGVIFASWWHHDAVLEGIAKCQKQSADAVAKQQIQDAQASQDAIDELNQDKERLQEALISKPMPPVRVCGRVYYVDRPVPAAPSTTSTAPSEPANPGADRGVPAGGGSGDVGPGVRAITAAGELDALYYSRLYEWAMKTR